jgi:hypothetical protein
MIEVGDLVRIKNKYLKADIGAIFSRWRKSGHNRKADGSWKPMKYRGKQVIAKVLRIAVKEYDWRSKSWRIVVELDVPERHSFGGRPRNMLVSTDFLVVHRKGNGSVTGV